MDGHQNESGDVEAAADLLQNPVYIRHKYDSLIWDGQLFCAYWDFQNMLQ